MPKSEQILLGIRNSKLSHAQTNFFIKNANKISKINNEHSFEIKTIETSGDIFGTQRLDQIGGKGLFIKEIEKEIIEGNVDLGIHSMKDVPASEKIDKLEIVCWLKRYDSHDALLSRNGEGIWDLRPGAVIGTSSIRRRSQVLKLRKDLNIKLLRGNVDTRINKLDKSEYDAIILSLAGLQRLNKQHRVSEVLDHDQFLPAACQGAVGIQALRESKFKSLFNELNDSNTQIECVSERIVLKKINANCNSPVSVFAQINGDKISISSELIDHHGEILFRKKVEDNINKFKQLSSELGEEIIKTVGQEKINELDNLNDFNYTAKK
jgi:hydroxymethylbilane synthase